MAQTGEKKATENVTQSVDCKPSSVAIWPTAANAIITPALLEMRKNDQPLWKLSQTNTYFPSWWNLIE